MKMKMRGKKDEQDGDREHVFEPSRTNSRIQKPMTEYCQTWELVFTARATGQVLTYAFEL